MGNRRREPYLHGHNGLFDDADVPPIRDKAKRREEICRRALAETVAWNRAALGDPGETPERIAEGTGG